MITCGFYIYKNPLLCSYSTVRRVEMVFVEKMDVLDFVIETLREHEKALDELAHRLEFCLKSAPTAGPDVNGAPFEGTDLESWR
jgi:hypothetical protein